jgi:hypothetical protein
VGDDFASDETFIPANVSKESKVDLHKTVLRL